MERRFRVITDIWIARIGTVVGWTGLIFWGMITSVSISSLFSAKEALDWIMPWVCLGLTAIHYLLIRTAKGTRSLVGDFRYYAQILAKNKSLSALSEETGEDPEDVKKKLRTMCKRGYFKGHIDLQQDRMVLESSKGEYAARCPGCGATTRIRKTGGTCRYCGNPIQ